MARLSGGCITLAGLGWCLSSSLTANLHPAGTMEPFSPSTWLTEHELCFSNHLTRISILQNSLLLLDSRCCPLYTLYACRQWHHMPAARTTLMTGDPVLDTTGSSGSNLLALLCPDMGHPVTSSRTSLRALAPSTILKVSVTTYLHLNCEGWKM